LSTHPLAGLLGGPPAAPATPDRALARCLAPARGRSAQADSAQRADHSGPARRPALSPPGQPRIWLKQLKGGGEVALTGGPDDSPRFSPDGTSVLFIHTEGGRTSLHRITLLGNDPHKVVDDAQQGDWSPDGKLIAFVRFDHQQDKILSALFLIDAAGGAERELTCFESERVGYPRWSPDGRHIILNTPPLITSGVLREFYLVDVKDGSVREIRPEALGMLSTAAWSSPDEILYMQSESITGGGTSGAARAFRADIRNNRHRPLFWVGSGGTTLDLFPDGRVVFDSMSGRQSLREYDLDGHALPRWITHGTINDRQPVFAPGEGEWVVFSTKWRVAALELEPQREPGNLGFQPRRHRRAPGHA
jgi:Tol biopolymer transport system component